MGEKVITPMRKKTHIVGEARRTGTDGAFGRAVVVTRNHIIGHGEAVEDGLGGGQFVVGTVFGQIAEHQNQIGLVGIHFLDKGIQPGAVVRLRKVKVIDHNEGERHARMIPEGGAGRKDLRIEESFGS
jgi:hypothetical protein